MHTQDPSSPFHKTANTPAIFRTIHPQTGHKQDWNPEECNFQDKHDPINKWGDLVSMLYDSWYHKAT